MISFTSNSYLRNILPDDWIYIAGGEDSLVFRIKGSDDVAKLYAYNELAEGENVLKMYSDDTLRASQIMKSREFISNGYRMRIDIIPQGEKIDVMYRFLVSLGQRFIPGPCISDIDKRWYKDIKDDVLDAIAFTEEMLRREIGKNFRIAECNVKPVRNKRDKRIDLVITDLAASIERSYR